MVLFTYIARPPPRDTDRSFRKTMKSLIAIAETGMSLVSQDSVTQMTSALFWRATHSSSSTLQVKERVLEIRRDGIDTLGWTQGRDKNARALLTSECKWVPFKQFKVSVLDATLGYWQVRMDKESSKLCTFNTPFGRYRFTRLPFDIKSAPEVFQQTYVRTVWGHWRRKGYNGTLCKRHIVLQVKWPIDWTN